MGLLTVLYILGFNSIKVMLYLNYPFQEHELQLKKNNLFNTSGMKNMFNGPHTHLNLIFFLEILRFTEIEMTGRILQLRVII